MPRLDDQFTPPLAPSLPATASSARRAIIGLTLAGAVAGSLVALAWPATFRATSEVMLAPSVAALPDATSSALIDGQLRALRSGAVLRAAVEQLNLAADGEFNGNDAGPFGLGGTLANIGRLVAGDGAMIDERRQRAVETLASRIDFERIGNSPLVAISVQTADPQKSADIANALSQLFVAEITGSTIATQAQANHEALKGELVAAERAVAAFRTENGLLASAEEIDLLTEQLASARARTVALNTQIAAARDPGIDLMATGSITPSDAAAGNVSAVDDVRLRVADHRQRVDALSARLGPLHPELISAKAELDRAQRELDAETRRLSSALQGELAAAVRQEQEFAARVAQVKSQGEGADDKLSILRDLERVVEERRAALEAARNDTAAANFAGDGTRIVAAADTPSQASVPPLPVLSLAGALAGLLSGLGLSAWRREREEGEHEDAYRVDDEAPQDFDEHHHWDEDEGHLSEADTHHSEAPEMYSNSRRSRRDEPAHYAQPEPATQAHWAPQHPAPQPMSAPAAWHQPQQAPAYAQPYPGQQPYAQPQAPTVVYVPVAVPASMHQHLTQEQLALHAFIDQRTDAALDEIRHSLRALREAIEDIAEDRYYN